MENPTPGIQCRIVARISTGIHRFDGNSYKIRSDPSRSGRRIKSPGLVSKQRRCESLRLLDPGRTCQRHQLGQSQVKNNFDSTYKTGA